MRIPSLTSQPVFRLSLPRKQPVRFGSGLAASGFESGVITKANIDQHEPLLKGISIVLDKAYRGMLDAESWERQIGRFVRNEGGSMVYVRRGEKMVGTGMLLPDEGIPGEANTENIGVLPEEQGKGIGKILMQAIFDHARALGLHTLTLQVGGKNRNARKLYQDVGFKTLPGTENASVVHMVYNLKRLDATA